MDGLSGGSGECLDCPASVAGAEGWRGAFQQPARHPAGEAIQDCEGRAL